MAVAVPIHKLLYTRAEAAQCLGLKIRSIDYLLADGRLKSRRVGGRVLIQTSELSRFANSDSLQPITSAAREVR